MKPTHTETTVDLPPLSLRADVGTVNPDARTVEVVFSTGAAVDRMDYWSGKRFREVLSLDPKHVRLDRLNSGAPLLDAHSAWSVGDVLGTVEPGSVQLEKKRATATIRFSKREAVEPIWQDVRDGIIRSVSVGYRVHKFEEETGKNEIPVRTAVDWEPFEISMVPMPADAGAKVRAEDRGDLTPCVMLTRGTKETTMPDEKKPEETPAPPVDLDAVRTAAITAERERSDGIRKAVGIAKLPETFAADLVARGVTLDAARAAIFAEMAKASEQTQERTHVAVGEDTRDKFLRGALNWLLIKGGGLDVVARAEKADPSSYDPGEFRGLTLLDLARECLTRAGRPMRGLNKMRIVSEAFTLRAITQTTSDFTTLLENVMHKVLQANYAIAPNTWRLWCAQGSVSDFRAHNRYRMGSFGALDALNEAGEFRHKAIEDAEKASITATTKGNIIAVTRPMIVNDDMGALNNLLAMLGRAAALSVEVDSYASLAENAGLGPTVGSAPMFDATHSNISGGNAITAAALDLDAQYMAAQLDPWGNEYLDLKPAVLLLPRTLWGTARAINDSEKDPDTAASNKPNIMRGAFRDIIGSPRLTGTRRYLFADPAIAPVFEVAFLEGQTAPILETKDGWETDGAEMRVRFDYGVAGVDYRGAVTDAGV